NQFNEIAQAVATVGKLGNDALDLRPVGRTRAAAGGIRKEFRCQRGDKLLPPLNENFLEALDPIELLTTGQLTRRVDLRIAAIRLAPVADRVEVLQREAERIDFAMTVVAACHIAVLFELLANRFRAANVG